MRPVVLDIVDRLRDTASRGISSWGDLQMQAAGEIQVLRAERDNLAAALHRTEVREPVAWIVHAQFPYVTMDPPMKGGLPRTPLYK